MTDLRGRGSNLLIRRFVPNTRCSYRCVMSSGRVIFQGVAGGFGCRGNFFIRSKRRIPKVVDRGTGIGVCRFVSLLMGGTGVRATTLRTR